MNTYGTFEAYYLTVLPRTASEIAWIGTFQGFLLVVVGVMSGAFHDRGYFHPTLLEGSFPVSPEACNRSFLPLANRLRLCSVPSLRSVQDIKVAFVFGFFRAER